MTLSLFVKDPGSALTHFIGMIMAAIWQPCLFWLLLPSDGQLSCGCLHLQFLPAA